MSILDLKPITFFSGTQNILKPVLHALSIAINVFKRIQNSNSCLTRMFLAQFAIFSVPLKNVKNTQICSAVGLQNQN